MVVAIPGCLLLWVYMHQRILRAVQKRRSMEIVDRNTLTPGVDIIYHYFPKLSEKQREQYRQLGDLYPHWNTQINVVSRKDIDKLYLHHVLHSLAIAKFTNFVPGTRILDVGTGGGFPGIPLAILFPQAQFHLVDSIGKKIKVVREVAARSEEHTSELQSLLRISYYVFCLQKQNR